MFLDLDTIKKHLNIDSDFIDDDDYLIHLSEVAEATVGKHIDDNLESVACCNGGDLPAPLLHAMLLFIGNMYANREPVAFSNGYTLPLSYEYLLNPYRNYAGRSSK